MITIDPSQTTVPQLHPILLGAVSPRPIAFVSTIDEQGRPNLAPYSFFNVFSTNPPVAIFSPARRGRDNTTKHTLENAKKVAECVINIVNYSMVEKMSLASTEYAEGVNEFVKAGLTAVASEAVRPFRVQESPVQLECKILEIKELGNQGGAGNLIICEIVRIHIDPHVLDSDGKIDPRKMDQVARMGGHWYTRAVNGLFQLPQPTTQIGIGFDALPHDILHSKILTGNQLAQLAGVTSLPDETSVNEYKLTELAELFIEFEDDPAQLEETLHKRAAELLEQRNVSEAWLTLLAWNE